MRAAIDAYIKKENPGLKPVMDAARALVRGAVPKAQETRNPWGIPIFESNGALCYLMLGKKHTLPAALLDDRLTAIYLVSFSPVDIFLNQIRISINSW